MKFKNIIAAAMIGVTLTTSASALNVGHNKSKQFLALAKDPNGIVQVYDSKDLTLKMLRNRKGDIIIERCIGQCNGRKDGRILNARSQKYNYISYRGQKEIDKGDIVLSYFLYNPNTSYIDDVMERWDYVIDTVPVRKQIDISYYK